jgi:integrase
MWHTPYSVFRRRVAETKARSFYVQFWDDEAKTYLPARSIRKIAVELRLDSQDFRIDTLPGARAVADEAFRRGATKVTKSRDLHFGEYLVQFWDWETSDYIKGRLARKSNAIGRHYCQNNKSWVTRYLVPDLGHVKLRKVTTAQLESWFMGLKERTKLTPQTLNSILQAVTIGLKEAHRLGLLDRNPAATVRPLGRVNEVKGLLTTPELRQLLALNWPDQRCYLAFCVALVAGLRLGEIQALRKEDLATDHLILRHSWSKVEGLKSTKNKKPRVAPLPPDLVARLVGFVDANPHRGSWVFWDEKTPDTPLPVKRIENAYYSALAAIGIQDDKAKPPSPASRQGRALFVHGLRHQCNAMLRGVLPDEKLRELVGHSDIAMTRLYDHITDQDKEAILDAQKTRFLGLFPS